MKNKILKSMKNGLIPVLLTISHLSVFAKNYDAELLFHKTNIFLKNGKLVKNVLYEIKINNREGEEYSEILIPYSKLNKVSKVQAYIKDSVGEIVKKLKKSEISDRSYISAISFYEDDFVKEFTLRHSRYPYSLVYSYEMQQDEFLYIAYWMPVIDRNVPVHQAILHLEVPEDYSIAYRQNQIKESKQDTLDNLITYEWEADYNEVIHSEVLDPPLDNFLPWVSIVPNKFEFEKRGSFQSWKEYGDWQVEILNGASDLPEREISKILSLVKDVNDDREKIRKLYHYLQDDTRYLNVTIETGGLKPYPAWYVAENKYGDCKALSNYFKSILEVVGIKSFYTNVYGGSPNRDIDNDFPSQQFNHAILMIPLQTDTVWLDCTSDGPFNYLGTFTQNREAFIVEENNSHFECTPKLSPFDVLEGRKIIIQRKDGKTSMGRFENNFKGKMCELILGIDETLNETYKSRILQKYVVEKGFELEEYCILKPSRDAKSIGLNYTANTDKIYNYYGDEVVVKNIPFSLPEFEKPENRKLPVQIDYPIYKIDTLTYDIPTGLKFHSCLEEQKLISPFGEYELRIIENGQRVNVFKRVLIHAGDYSLADYPSLYAFYDEISRTENGAIIKLTK